MLKVATATERAKKSNVNVGLFGEVV